MGRISPLEGWATAESRQGRSCELLLSGSGEQRAALGVAKVEGRPGRPYPRVGFIVTNLSPAFKRMAKFYNGRGTNC